MAAWINDKCDERTFGGKDPLSQKLGGLGGRKGVKLQGFVVSKFQSYKVSKFKSCKVARHLSFKQQSFEVSQIHNNVCIPTVKNKGCKAFHNKN